VPPLIGLFSLGSATRLWQRGAPAGDL